MSWKHTSALSRQRLRINTWPGDAKSPMLASDETLELLVLDINSACSCAPSSPFHILHFASSAATSETRDLASSPKQDTTCVLLWPCLYQDMAWGKISKRFISYIDDFELVAYNQSAISHRVQNTIRKSFMYRWCFAHAWICWRMCWHCFLWNIALTGPYFLRTM